MAHTNGVSHAREVLPPPSSMLATHFVNRHGVPKLSANDFTELLRESLGTDDRGEPNIRDDKTVNLKLISVIVSVGIEPYVDPSSDDPFQKRPDPGKNVSELKDCLNAILLAVQRSPDILFEDVDANGATDQPTKVPLHAWLLPILVLVVARLSNAEVSSRCSEILGVCLNIDEICACGTCGNVLESARDILSVCAKKALSLSNATASLSGDEHAQEQDSNAVSISESCRSLVQQMKSWKISDHIFAGLFIIQSLLTRPLARSVTLQLKKQLKSLNTAAQTLQSSDVHEDQIQALKSKIAGLSLITYSKTDQQPFEQHEDFPNTDRARKRLRMSSDRLIADDTQDVSVIAAKSLTQLLSGQAVPDFDTLASTCSSHFRRLDDNQRCVAILELGRTACQLAGGSKSLDCRVCDDGIWQVVTCGGAGKIEKLLDTLETLQSNLERGLKLRLVALDSYRRVLNHIASARRVDLTTAIAGKFALQMLRSSSRDCRVKAAQLLQAFVRRLPEDSESMSRQNRVAVLEYLQSLWQSGRLLTQEAVVLSLFHIAEVVGEEELNIILLRLVEYLGHPNVYISGLVASEFVQLAQTLHINMQRLFRPFWRTISVVVVKNLPSRPAVAQQLCELLGMQITGLYQLIEEDALPYLVLMGQTDTIQRMASSSNSPLNAFELCVKPNNLPKILATLLAQDYDDAEDTVVEILYKISPDFGEQDLTAWLSINHSKIACELLKFLGDAGYGKGTKILKGLQLLAQLAHRKSSASSGGRRSDLIPAFLESNAWEIVTLFTSIFDDTVSREMNVERRRCLAALGEVVRHGKGRIDFVVPSICACLRSAMADPALCSVAYLAWTTMMLNLGEDVVVNLLDQTFALTVCHWSDLDSEMQQAARKALVQLLKKQRSALRERADSLPRLGAIAELADLGGEVESMRQNKEQINELLTFTQRLRRETLVVAQLAMLELVEYLRAKSDFIQRSVAREQPDAVIADLIRAILDCAVRFNNDEQIVLHAAQCFGTIGRVDSSRIDSVREKLSMIVLSNFAIAAETTTFLLFFVEQVVVKEYVSASSLRSKTFLGWALQELLKLCQVTPEMTSRTRVGAMSGKDKQWFELGEETRLVLTPFITSKFLAPGKRNTQPDDYPIFKSSLSFEEWLTKLTLDLLNKGLSQNVDLVFEVCWRMVHFSRGTAISSFLLPYTALNLLLNGTNTEKEELSTEFLCILTQPYNSSDSSVQETIRQCSQSVFDVVDYLSKWLQEKRRWFSNAQIRMERGIRDPAIETATPQIESVETLLKSIPPQVITQRSVECKSYARALVHWEEYIHSKETPDDEDYRQLQAIYAQIDELDGIEGISSCMQVLNPESQILEHRKAGRWQAAQNWYEMQMTENPENVDVQVNLLHALKESGQHDVLLHHFGGMTGKRTDIDPRLLPYATEAAWSTARFDELSNFIRQGVDDDFNTHLGSHLLKLCNQGSGQMNDLEDLWMVSAEGLSYNSTASIASSSDFMLKMHVAEDLRLMIEADNVNKTKTLDVLEQRLDVLGTDLVAKHYVLNVQRAVMHLRKEVFNDNDISASWLKTAKLARKARASNQAFDAVLRASALGDESVVIEQAKLMWLEGRHRKAIKTLEAAIDSGAFNSHAYIAEKDSMLSRSEMQEQNNMTARAYVLLGKWLGQAGQTQSEVIIKTFRKSTEQNRMWERGWYHLGRHYNRILESERQKPPGKENQPFLTGEAAKTVIDNFLRALVCGNKYLFQTLPKMLTLWLELVSNPGVEQDTRRGNSKFHDHLAAQRKKVITETNANVKKYVDRLAPIALYTILPQLVARISHQDPIVYEILQGMIAKVIHSFPQQAMWTLMAVTKSVDKLRAQRGLSVINKVVDLQKKSAKNGSPSEMRTLISAAQRFTDELLRVADYHIEGKISKISLARDLGFNHKIAPSKLVVPAEICLIPNIPTSNDGATMKTFRAFSKEPVTITAFTDEALVLASLQKPRKMSIRGSDGLTYAILAKPKDDLRKDQRLMEFDTMINRFLKHDIDATKRRLYIRTYAVIPLNEECGVIEWVPSLKTMRDVLLKLYRERNVLIDYAHIRTTLDDICAKSSDKAKDFTERILPIFPPVLRYWFMEIFPDPSAWLAARVRYTRSAAVMSMVGHILGLGDRHGENILFEEDNGGVMHVDFNCLFDKGLTFDKPECVPFRLTHNMVDAFGTFGVEGPFRKSCEITMQLLRNHEDGLMTILETFLHDPTTDFMTAGKRRKVKDADMAGVVPDTAEKMLEGVRGKVRGMLRGESVPLSVGGYVEVMVRAAADRANLARMYIGWCAFL